MSNLPTKRARKGPRPKHVPVRTCVVCREKDAKREFVRLVRTPEGVVEVDRTGKKSGRGAYLCRRHSCWQQAAAGTALSRALRTEIDEGVRAALRKYADEHFRKEEDAGA